jgi:hypothetical protein
VHRLDTRGETAVARILSVLTIVLIALLVVPLSALAGGGGGGGGPCRGYADGTRLEMLDNCFDGVGHVVEEGSTLEVVNAGRLQHTFTAVDGSFDTGILEPGEQAEIEVGDGTVKRIGPGDVILAEDLTGQGHITRGVGDQPRLSVVVPLADEQP